MIKNLFQNLVKDNKQFNKRFEVVNVSDTVDEIYIYDYIGEIWWDEGLSAKQLTDLLNECTKPEINIRINSPGGIVFEGRTMSTAIKNKAKTTKITAYIDGLCASAATTVALACESVVMADGAMFMIHNAQGMTWGDKNVMLKEAELLEKLDLDIASDYSNKTGISQDEIKTMMNEETWLSATEAKDKGFIDVVEHERNVDNTFNISGFDNAPKNWSQKPKQDKQPAPVVVNEPENTKTPASKETISRMASIRINQLSS